MIDSKREEAVYAVEFAKKIKRNRYQKVSDNDINIHKNKVTTNPANRIKHENGIRRKKKDLGGEKGDLKRRVNPNKRPKNIEVYGSPNFGARIGFGVVAVAGIVGIAFLVLNDTTGIGVFDDGAIIHLATIVWDSGGKALGLA